MIRKGRGMGCIIYPTGPNGGGDTETISMRLKRDGCVDMSNGLSELGQGLKIVAVQIGAEALGIDPQYVGFNNSDTELCSYSSTSAGSRSTYVMGNAILDGSKKMIEEVKKYGAKMLGCEYDCITYKDGTVFVTEDPEKKLTLRQIGNDANLKACPIDVVGAFRPPVVPVDRKTGKGLPSRSYGWGATVADISVDDETGVVIVDNLYTCYDIGVVINPLAAIGQADGGDVMGIGMALFEDTIPSYPESMKFQTANYTDYIIPTFMDMAKHSEVEFISNPDKYGPYGVKGFGEMVNNTQPSAIGNAIYNAIGIVTDSLPITPEKILRKLEEKEKQNQ